VDVSLQAIKLKPDFVKAYNSLGTAYNKLGRYPEAIENYRQAIRLNPGYVTAHYNLGQTYLAAGDRNFALEEFKILQKLDMTKANLLFNDINK
jgi:tetratricopeptide (TPR) repeat protein